MPVPPTTPEEEWRYTKSHAAPDLHTVIDAVYQFAEESGGEFSTHSPADLGLIVTWRDVGGLSRNISIAVNDDLRPLKLRVYFAAWRDDATRKKRLHFGGEVTEISAPIYITALKQALHSAHESAIAIKEDDLKETTTLRHLQ